MSKTTKINNVSKSTRATILDILIHCENGSYANEILPSRLSRSKFSDPDKALITKVVYSTLRGQIKFDYAIEKISSRQLSKIDPIAKVALRSIAAQMHDGFEMHAALNETVKALPFSLKGFVNAIARKAIELNQNNQLFVNEPEYISYGLPFWIFEEVKKVFGLDYKNVCESFNRDSYVTLAPISANPIEIQFDKNGDLISEALLVRRTGNLQQSKALTSGSYIVADQGSQLIAKVLTPTSLDLVHDVCSAPGGKTILLSKKAGHIVSADISPKRLLRLVENVERIGIKNVSIIASDAKKLPLRDLGFKHILVDAPCSGLGVMRRRPDLRHNISKSDIEDLREIQKQILDESISKLAQGGELVFSVCTFTQSETIEIDEWLEENYSELHSVDFDFESPLLHKSGRGYLLRATEENDSMYFLKLRKG